MSVPQPAHPQTFSLLSICVTHGHQLVARSAQPASRSAPPHAHHPGHRAPVRRQPRGRGRVVRRSPGGGGEAGRGWVARLSSPELRQQQRRGRGGRSEALRGRCSGTNSCTLVGICYWSRGTRCTSTFTYKLTVLHAIRHIQLYIYLTLSAPGTRTHTACS